MHHVRAEAASMNFDYARAIRWIRLPAALWALAVISSIFAPTASARERSANVVVMESAGSGSAPEAAVKRLGGSVGRHIGLVNGFVARVPSNGLAELRRTQGVQTVHRDRTFTMRSADDPAAIVNTSLDSVRASIGAASVSAGARVDVALVDSGISPVGALAGRVVNGPDFSADARVSELRSLDALGHGTHLAGIVAGVAPNARLVNVKVADHNGETTLGQLLAGIDWVARRGDNDGLNVRVLNLAFGSAPEGSYRNDPLAVAVERAWDQGIAVVVAAGNGGAEAPGLDSPANDPYVIAAGAVNSRGTAELGDDVMAPFSSRGTAQRGVDVVAPGVGIVSTRVAGSLLDETFAVARIGEDGFRGSGTSQAAAVVSGATALLLGRRGGLDNDDVKALLRSSAHPLAGVDSAIQGAGVIDVANAAVTRTPRFSDQNFPAARMGGWQRRGPGMAFAGENPQGSRWSGSRWSGSRWSGSRWSGSRWSGSRWSGSRWSGSRWSGSRWSGSRWSSDTWGGLPALADAVEGVVPALTDAVEGVLPL
jgi:serine protease AprX